MVGKELLNFKVIYNKVEKVAVAFVMEKVAIAFVMGKVVAVVTTSIMVKEVVISIVEKVGLRYFLVAVDEVFQIKES